MTPTQRKLLKVLHQQIETEGRCQTLQGLATSMLVKSTSHIAKMIWALDEQGLITRVPGKAHSIELTKRGLKEVGILSEFFPVPIELLLPGGTLCGKFERDGNTVKISVPEWPVHSGPPKITGMPRIVPLDQPEDK